MRYSIIVVLLFVSLSSFGQVRKLIRKGNKEFDKGNYSQAVLSFRQAQAVDTTSGDITYNIGNALFKQKKYEEALGGYQKSIRQSKEPGSLAMNFHNAGNAFFKLNKYQESVDAFKKSLRFNPSDNQTRYNLALAQQKLKDQQKNDNKNKDKNKDKDKNNKDNKKDKNKDNKDNKDKNKKDDQNKNKDNKDNKQNQPQQPKISKEDAQRMLDALQTGENKAQERIKAQRVKAQSRKPEKNW